MPALKVVSARCPTCGANISVPPGAAQVTCRYCQNVIHVEHRRPPPHVHPFGTPGGMPSRTLYVDPAAASEAGRKVGYIILVTALLPILIPLAIGVGPWAFKACKGAIKPFPATCNTNEELELSGNYEGPGPIVTSVGHNCKIHIKNAKLKGSTLLKTDASNVQLTLHDVTIETTETMVKTGSNLKAKIHGSTLSSTATVFESDSNMELQELESSTLESKGAAAIKSRYNLKIHADNAKIRGKRAAIDAESGLELSMKKASEITSEGGPAVKASSGFKLEADSGRIDGAGGAILTQSGTRIVATGLVLSSKEAALKTTSGLDLDFTAGSITSLTDSAIEGDSGMNLTLDGVKVTGATAAIRTSSGLKLKASKKTSISASAGDGLLATSGADVILNDAAIEAAGRAFKSSTNTKMKLSPGARVAGKKAGIEAEGNLQLEASGSTIDGGSGPGIAASYGARISLRQGNLKGAPALQLDRKPSSLELDGTKVEGQQRVSAH